MIVFTTFPTDASGWVTLISLIVGLLATIASLVPPFVWFIRLKIKTIIKERKAIVTDNIEPISDGDIIKLLYPVRV